MAKASVWDDEGQPLRDRAVVFARARDLGNDYEVSTFAVALAEFAKLELDRSKALTFSSSGGFLSKATDG